MSFFLKTSLQYERLLYTDKFIFIPFIKFIKEVFPICPGPNRRICKFDFIKHNASYETIIDDFVGAIKN